MSGGTYGNLYSGDWLKADDLQAEYTPVIVTAIRPEDIRQKNGSTKKMLCIGFHGTVKRLILNVTNYNTLCEILGKNEPAWDGHQISLHKTTTEMNGKIVPCIRVAPSQQTAPPPSPYPQPQPAFVPQAAPAAPPVAAPAPVVPAFAAPAIAPPAPAVPAETGFGAAPAPPVEAYGQAYDDDLPF